MKPEQAELLGPSFLIGKGTGLSLIGPPIKRDGGVLPHWERPRRGMEWVESDGVKNGN